MCSGDWEGVHYGVELSYEIFGTHTRTFCSLHLHFVRFSQESDCAGCRYWPCIVLAVYHDVLMFEFLCYISMYSLCRHAWNVWLRCSRHVFINVAPACLPASILKAVVPTVTSAYNFLKFADMHSHSPHYWTLKTSLCFLWNYGLVSSMQSTNCCCVLPVHKAPRINLENFGTVTSHVFLLPGLMNVFFFYMCRHCFCNCAICKGNSKGNNSNCQLAQTENLVIQQTSSSETCIGFVCSFVQLVGGQRYKNTWMSCILLCPAQNEFIKITLNWHFTVTLRKLVLNNLMYLNSVSVFSTFHKSYYSCYMLLKSFNIKSFGHFYAYFHKTILSIKSFFTYKINKANYII